MTTDTGEQQSMSSTATVSDDDLLTTLYSVHYRSLLRLAALLLDDLAACEDVVQEAYIRVHGARARLRDQDKALAYLRQTVVNLSRSTLRRRVVAARHAASAEHDAYALVERDAVVVALKALPRRQREAVVLRYYADATEAQAAAVMGVSVGAVKSYTSRGLAGLGALLEDLR
jgi:RNA polymerase sigma-70 factor (sigma-E family)